jgi:hypothetical protein
MMVSITAGGMVKMKCLDSSQHLESDRMLPELDYLHPSIVETHNLYTSPL